MIPLLLAAVTASTAASFNKAEAEAGWEAVESLYEQTAFEVVAQGSDNLGHWLDNYFLALGSDSFLMLRNKGVLGGNALYSFELKPRGLTQWRTKRVDQPAKWPTTEFFWAAERSAFCVYDIPMKILIIDPSFEVSEVKTGELSFKLAPGHVIDHGTIRYDPRNWVITWSDVWLRDRPDHRVTTELVYGAPQQWLNIKTIHIRSSITTDGGWRIASWDTEFMRCTRSPLQPAATRLSAFGLPEPGKIAEPGSLPWAFINFAGVGVAIVVFLLWRWHRVLRACRRRRRYGDVPAVNFHRHEQDSSTGRRPES